MADEIEIKVDLGSFSNYLKLLGHLGSTGQEEHQQNFFFDTTDHLLKNRGWALRLRTTDSQAFVTLKGTTSQAGAAAVREEIESEIPLALGGQVARSEKSILMVIAEPIERIRPLVQERELIPLISFDNFRKTHPYRLNDGEYQFEVDRTEFADGHVDYELEIEVEAHTKVYGLVHELSRLFASLEIPFVLQTESKLARALDHPRQ